MVEISELTRKQLWAVLKALEHIVDCTKRSRGGIFAQVRQAHQQDTRDEWLLEKTLIETSIVFVFLI